jgi:hypothetical protein
MRTLLIVLGILAISVAALADTVYAPSANGGDARGTAIVQEGNWVLAGSTWTWVPTVGSGVTPVGLFDVQADVTIWEKDKWDASVFYFHFGDTSGIPEKDVVIGGTLSCNTNVDVTITGPAGCDIHQLKKDGANGAVNDQPDAVIPIDWFYGESLTGTFTECDDTALNVVRGWPSYTMGNCFEKPLYIKVVASPTQLQSDGHYKLDPTIACTPQILN